MDPPIPETLKEEEEDFTPPVSAAVPGPSSALDDLKSREASDDDIALAKKQRLVS